MTTPRAKYEIAAEDKTGPAWQSAVGRAEKSVGQLKSFLTTAFAGVVGVGALTSQISKAIEFGDEIGKMKVKANLTAQATQELAYAFKQFDIDTGSLSVALKKMNVTISEFASGGKEAQEVFAAIGVPLKALEGLKSDERLELIADAISHLGKEEDRARALTAIFGKAGFDLAPAFENGAAGIRSAREEIRQMGRVLDEDQIQKLGEADDAIKRLKQSWGSFAADLTSKVAPALTGIFDTLSGGHTAATSFQGRLDELERLKENRDAFVGFNGDETNAELDRRISTLERQILGSGGHGAIQPRSQAAAPGFAVTEQVTPVHHINRNNSLFQELDENFKYLEELQKRTDEWADVLSDLQANTDDAVSARTEALVDDDLKGMQEKFAEIEKGFGDLSVFADQAARNMQDAFAQFLFDPFADGLKGMLKGFIDVVRKMLAEAAAAKIFGLFGGGGKGGFFGSILGAALGSSTGGGGASTRFGGYKAGGGPLQSGKWYIAGEKGPERIWGGGTGAFAMGYGGGGVTVHSPVSIDARGATRDAAAALAQSLPAILEQNNKRLESRIIEGIRRRRYPV